MNNCEEFEELLDGYVNHSLDAVQTRVLLAHLSGCKQCREELAFLLSVKRAASASFAPLPDKIRTSAFALVRSETNGLQNQAQEITNIRDAMTRVREAIAVTRAVVRFAYKLQTEVL